MTPLLTTPRLMLREMLAEDVEALLCVFSDPIAMRFYPKPFDRAMTAAWVERNLQRYVQHGIGLWAMVLTATGEVIGDSGLVLQNLNGAMVIEIGYHVRRDLWGQGLATEAALACREYGFAEVGCDQLVSLIHPNNVASRRVAEKIGMSLTQQIEWHRRPTCVYTIEAPKAPSNNDSSRAPGGY